MGETNMSGLELSRHFYRDAVAPVISRNWPSLRYSAALIGSGSEVLGFDDSMSRDHHWGPRLLLFLGSADRSDIGEALSGRLARELPVSFLGYPTNFTSPNPNDNGVRIMQETEEGPVRHMVDIVDLPGFLQEYIGVDSEQDLSLCDWLTLPEQKLRSLTAGEVFHDGLTGADSTGVLTQMRKTLAYYPKDVWYYQMAAVWARIGQEEHLMGRAGSVGDEVGSAVIGARLVRDVMRLSFLMERTYAPYPKWFGTAFKKLRIGRELYPTLRRALASLDWRTRESALVVAYERLAMAHNSLQATEPMPEKVARFHGRPYRVIAMQGFAEALLSEIRTELLTETTRRSPIGGIDQISDNTDLLEDHRFRPALRSLYQTRP